MPGQTPEEVEISAANLKPLEDKLATIRKKLLTDVGIEELKRMQIHAELLENALTNAVNYHHHDTNEHHDHETLVLMPGLEPRRIKPRI